MTIQESKVLRDSKILRDSKLFKESIIKPEESESDQNLRISKDIESTKEILKSIKTLKDEFIKAETFDLKAKLDELQSVDICLMVDQTESMYKHIKTAADTMLTLMEKTQNIYPASKIRFAFLGYTDFDTPMPFKIIDFDHDKFRVMKEINELKTYKSQDYCEDVNGAL